MNIYCPNCKIDFEAIVWEDGNCPECGESYSWDCGYSEELDDEVIDVYWK